MPTKARPSTASGSAAKSRAHSIYHKDGSIYAKGRMLGGKMHGYWEFFRKSGVIMRSGSFDREKQVGTWTTYDASGKPVKVTEMNTDGSPKPKRKAAGGGVKAPTTKRKKVRLLSGGNPQIAKADGDAPVQAYIAAMPGWKSDVGRRLDALIVRSVPGVRKAVKWNSPLYGLDAPGGKVGWFLGVHVFNRYIKVAFFRGASLKPMPPDASKDKNTRYLHIHEEEWGARLDEALVADWVKQAAALPGWVPDLS